MRSLTLLLIAASALTAQVYSPKLLRAGQPDPTDLKKFAEAIYAQAGAHTPREKAEAIWRFFLTDGRFVKPGFWYHIAGWTYEEPAGEVLDPIKLLNSYGFGLCYHIAPLLGAVFEAGGFEDARTWFLTGHTVTEVFYDGAYHYYDSDMMGYNVEGAGPFRGKQVASVRALEQDPGIILGKLQSPDRVQPGVVDYPWYPADVRAKAMGDLADLFTSSKDNFLYPYTRYSPGHSMDFVLRPGEKLIRFFQPEEPGLFYLPYKFDGATWSEFPQEIAEYQIKTVDGPRSQKDGRAWATGRIEYTPPALPSADEVVLSMPSPYVIIDARFTMKADLRSNDSFLRIETSTDGRRTWQPAGALKGTFHGDFAAEPAVLVKSAHGRLTAVSGSYGYEVRITKSKAQLSALRLVSRIQVNPRSLPSVQPGDNQFTYSSAPAISRVSVPAPLDRAPATGLQLVSENGQGFLKPVSGKTGELNYALDANGALLAGFDFGARLLDIRDGLAPDKLTAETRHTSAFMGIGDASIAWSASPDGPFQLLWKYPENLPWRDGETIDRLLRWPEVFRQVRDLPPGTERVYVKIRSSGPAIDNLRMAVYAVSAPPLGHLKGHLKITQVWHEGAVRHQHVEELDAAAAAKNFSIHAGADVRNDALIMSTDLP